MYPMDIGSKLNVNTTFRMSSERLMYVQVLYPGGKAFLPEAKQYLGN